MPYTLNSFLLDLGGWFASAFPAMNGRFFTPPVLLVTAAGFRNAEIPLLEDMDLL